MGHRLAAPPAAPVVVVGGGLAGAAAATVLAEQGVPVCLLERRPYLGGRLGAWDDRLATGEPVQMSRGFHAFFRQYRNVRTLLGRVDPLMRCLEPLDDYLVFGPDGARESYGDLPRWPPLNAIALMWRSPTVTLKSLRHMDGGAAREMMRFDPDDTFARLDGISAGEYLDRLGMPPEARQMLFETPARSFFNPEDRLSAAELVMMFHFYFLGSNDGLVFDVLNEPFSDALWKPLQRHLQSLGASVLVGVEAAALERIAGDEAGVKWLVHLDHGEPLRASAVVLAADVAGVRRILAQSPGVGPAGWRESMAELATAPPFAVWRLWLNAPTRAERPSFAATVGMGALDNVSLLHHYEGESRRWALRTGGSVVELHAYALAGAGDERRARADLRGALHALYPETASAGVVDERYLLSEDCPAFPPGSHRRRPTVETPVDGLALAGDFVSLPFPTALMERAVASGMLAANHVLAGSGASARPAQVQTVRRRGVLAGVPWGRRRW